MQDLAGKVAFLTGAGRGVGVGIAMALAKAGATIGLFGRTRETLEHTAARIAELGGRSLVCVGDVSVRADVDRAVAEVQERLGPIWALVNNAYSAERTPVEDITDEILDGALRACVHGTLYTMQACFPTMKERGGRIINFGSGGATMGLPELGAYNIAKEGVRGLTKTAAAGWGKYGITVNTICPLSASDAREVSMRPVFLRCSQSVRLLDCSHSLPPLEPRRCARWFVRDPCSTEMTSTPRHRIRS